MMKINCLTSILLLFCTQFSNGFPHIRRMQEEEPITITEPPNEEDSIVDDSILGDIQSCLEAKNGSGFYRLLISNQNETTSDIDMDMNEPSSSDSSMVVFCEMDLKEGNWMRVAHLAGDQWDGYCSPSSSSTMNTDYEVEEEYDLGMHPEEWRIGKINDTVLKHFFDSYAWRKGFHLNEVPSENMTVNESSSSHLGYEVLLKLPNEGGRSAWLFGQALESTYSTEDSQIISTFICADNTTENMTVDSNGRYFWGCGPSDGNEVEDPDEDATTDVKICGCGPLGLVPASMPDDHNMRLLKKGHRYGHKTRRHRHKGSGY